MFKKLAVRMFVTIIGILFIMYSIVWGMLGILGEKTTGLITDVRREMGERDEPKSGSYTYSISYSFELPDGKLVYGYAKEISDGVFIKKPNTSVNVRYLEILPQINALEKDAAFDLGKITMILTGCFLVFVVKVLIKEEGSLH
ncbi:MAG: hypothetical protein AB7V48_15825 [Sedimentibacter sp.]